MPSGAGSPKSPVADERLAAAHAAGAGDHPVVDVPVADFADHLEGMARRQARALAPATVDARRSWLLGHVRPGEVYLAAGCDRSLAHAWERFATVVLPWLRGVLERRGARSHEVDGLVGETPGLMVLPPRSGEARTTLGTWDGRARLTSWLAAITLRRWAGQRARAVPGHLEEDDPAGARRQPAITPLVAALDHEAARQLEITLDEGWGSLTDRERLALLLRYRGGLPQRRIAELLGVGEPRVSRLLGAAIERLRAATAKVLDPAVERSPFLAAALARWLASREGGDAPRSEDAASPESSRDA